MRESLLLVSAVMLGWALNNLWREERSRLAWEATQEALKSQAEWEAFRQRQSESEPAAGVA